MKKSKIILLTFLSLFSSQILKSQSNTDLGVNAGNAGSYNSSFGYYAGDLVTGSYNTFNGHYAGKITTSGYYNVFSGAFAGYSNETGDYNTYIGYKAGLSATGANTNVAIGYYSGYSLSTGSSNVFLGMYSGRNTTTGTRNVYMGYGGGYTTTGSDNVFLGYQSGYSETGSNKLYIENSSSTSPLIYGEFDNDFVTINGKLGIGTTNFDNAQLAVNGTIAAKGTILIIDDFPDYVFEKEYQLMTIRELDLFLQNNRHLPGIKSKECVLKDGLSLGELSVQLLEKIEELTLHIINLDKKRIEIRNQNAVIQETIESMLNEI